MNAVQHNWYAPQDLKGSVNTWNAAAAILFYVVISQSFILSLSCKVQLMSLKTRSVSGASDSPATSILSCLLNLIVKLIVTLFITVTVILSDSCYTVGLQSSQLHFVLLKCR